MSDLKKKIGSSSSAVKMSNYATLPASVEVTELTEEEKTDMRSLYEQHEETIAQSRRDHFKSLPPGVRQAVVDIRAVMTATREMDETKHERPDRLIELELKQDRAEIIFNQGPTYARMDKCEDGTWYRPFSGMSDKDLDNAHLDATLDETVLENKEDA